MTSDLSSEMPPVTDDKDSVSALFHVSDERRPPSVSSASSGAAVRRFHVVEDAACVNEGLRRWDALQVNSFSRPPFSIPIIVAITTFLFLVSTLVQHCSELARI